MLKIQGGCASGCSLLAPAGDITRPTGSRIREAVFNVLRPNIGGSLFVDLFAGSGIMGLQAASEGASTIIQVEKDNRVFQLLRANQQKLVSHCNGKLHAELSCIKRDLLKAKSYKMPNLLNIFKKADFIWADPPYPKIAEFLEAALPLIEEELKEEATFILECPTSDSQKFEKLLSRRLVVEKSKKYGNTTIIYITR